MECEDVGGVLWHDQPVRKIMCILGLCQARQWSFCLLQDLVFPENGVREYRTEAETWTLIIQSKVGVLLNSHMTEMWRRTGAEILVVGRKEARDARNVMVVVDAHIEGTRAFVSLPHTLRRQI